MACSRAGPTTRSAAERTARPAAGPTAPSTADRTAPPAAGPTAPSTADRTACSAAERTARSASWSSSGVASTRMTVPPSRVARAWAKCVLIPPAPQPRSITVGCGGSFATRRSAIEACAGASRVSAARRRASRSAQSMWSCVCPDTSSFNTNPDCHERERAWKGPRRNLPGSTNRVIDVASDRRPDRAQRLQPADLSQVGTEPRAVPPVGRSAGGTSLWRGERQFGGR